MARSEADDDALRAICRGWWGDAAVRLRPLVGDGFSGAALVHVALEDGAGDVVLKPFPTASRAKVEWVHHLMRHLRERGCDEVPEVLETTRGGFVADDGRGRIWEAVRFVAGTTTDAPSSGQAAAALETLARIHLAAATWPTAPTRVGPAAAVIRRGDQASRLLAVPWRPGFGVRPGDSLAEGLAVRLERASVIAREHDLAAALRGIAGLHPPAVAQHAVLRDVWSGHVLFADDRPPRVSGVIDFHAAAVDTPATDIARLIGSWCRDADIPPDAAWAEAVAAYERVRPLSNAEKSLIPWLDASGTILGLDNWFRWVIVEGRQFADAGQVLGRVDRLVSRLQAAIATLDRLATAV
jgi:Ser/Thr protein kinase RdoA (MazF antagonist)